MSGGDKLGAFTVVVACASLVASIAIIASCQRAVELTDARIADCAHAGGHWNYNGGNGFCEGDGK